MSRWQIIVAIDKDRRAVETYSANFPGEEVRCASVADEIERLPYADVIIGGPPCQPHSLAGKRQASKDVRDCGPDFVEAVKRVQPRMFLMENVPGLLTSEHGRYWPKLFASMESAGYYVEYAVQDAVSFGVPQFRKRLWVWGIRNDLAKTGTRQQWPRPTHVWPWPEASMFGGDLLNAVTVRQALNLTGAAIGGGRNPRFRGDVREERDITDEPSTTLACDAGNATPIVMETGSKCRRDSHGTPRGPLVKTLDNPAFTIDSRAMDLTIGRKRGKGQTARHGEREDAPIDEPSPTVPANMALGGGSGLFLKKKVSGAEHGIAVDDEPAPTIKAGGNRDRSGKQGGGCPPLYLKSHADEPSGLDEPCKTLRSGRAGHDGCRLELMDKPCPTISAGGHETGGPEPIHNRKRHGFIRRLTPLECLRLQSGPDDFAWPDDITKTAMYAIVGNGFACRHAHAFAKEFAEVDPESTTIIDLFCGGGLAAVGWHGRFWIHEQ